QLEIDAQSRQIKRHEEDLATLREERELYLRKADQNQAELAQAMRRERAGQEVVAEAKAEVEELKGELGRMQETFARHRSVVQKNQEVIDAHEKALNDARSELLSFCLEAEKQSARHQKVFADAASEASRATGEKTSALHELRILRIEKEELKDRLEETSRKVDELRAQQQERRQRLEPVASVGENQVKAAPQSHASLKLISISSSPSRTTNTTAPDRRPSAESQAHPGSFLANAGGGGRKLWVSNFLPQQQLRSSSPISTSTKIDQRDSSIPQRQDSRASFQPKYLTAPKRASTQTRDGPPSISIDRPSRDCTERRTEAGASLECPSPPLDRGTDANASSSPPSSFSPQHLMVPASVDTHYSAGVTASPADAGGGVAGNGDGGGAGRGATHGNAKGGGAGEDGGEVRVIRSRKDRLSLGGGGGGGADGDASSPAKGDTSSRRSSSRPGSPSGMAAPSEWGPDNNDTNDLEGTPTAGASPHAYGVGGSRKRSKTAAATGHAAGATDGDGFGGTSGPPSRPSSLMSSAPCDGQHHFVGVADSGNDGDPNDAETAPVEEGEDEGTCPACGDSPYGLMINCSGCSRQHHSSCVPEGRRVGKGLGSVFHCSKC
ncbi:unnamed protein product, partial [Hapterophycus canaliculatus]